MNLFEAILLGAVQGLTEFLPVSSSAHLILARMVFGWDAEHPGLAFDVACHVGTLVAVVAYFRRDVLAMVRQLPSIGRRDRTGSARLVQLIAIGTIPVVVIGLLLAASIEAHMRTPAVAAVTLAAGAVLFLVVERVAARTRDEGSLSTGEALAIGVAQAAALVPGVSRSGATITVAMFAGLRRDAAARFSFLLGVPAIVGAAGHAGLGLLHTGLSRDDMTLFLAGMAVSAVVGYAAISFLLRYLSGHSLAIFAWYRLGLAAAVVLMWMAGLG